MPSVGFPLSCLRVPGVPAVNGLKFKKAECQFCTWVTTTPVHPYKAERWEGVMGMGQVGLGDRRDLFQPS